MESGNLKGKEMAVQLQDRNQEIDLHGYHPDDIDLLAVVRQAWESGASGLRLIHGHGRNRGISPGFVNTNTGYFGLRVRSDLRHGPELKPYVVRSSLDCSHNGSTFIRLRSNPAYPGTEAALKEQRQ